MNLFKVQLHISQIQSVIQSSRSTFQNPKKQKIYDELIQLFNAVKDSNLNAFDNNDLAIARDALDDVFNGIEHLHYAQEDELPKELIYCLDLALDDWFKDSQDYFVAISYNNTSNQFYIRARDVQELLRKQIDYKALFNCHYNQLLVQISIPRTIIDDFLGSIPVYHELGHFIDFNYQITRSLFDSTASYRPDLEAKSYGRTEHLFHLREHFADIFSAQYLGKSSLATLSYLAFDAPSNFTHPSTKKRISVVNSFLDGTGPKNDLEIIDALKKSTLKRTNGRKLDIKYKDDFDSIFDTNKEIKLLNPCQIHGILVRGWEHLESGIFLPIDNDDPTLKCSRINRLIKESVSLSLPKTTN